MFTFILLWDVVNIEQILMAIGVIVSEYAGIAFLIIIVAGYFILSRPDQPHTSIEGWGRIQAEQKEPGLYERYIRSDEWINRPITTQTDTAPKNRIKVQFKPTINEKNQFALNELERKKRNLIEKKDEFISGSSREVYNSQIAEYNKKISKINASTILESKIQSWKNPVIETEVGDSQQVRMYADRKEYQQYIHSYLWRKRSKEFRASKNGICDICHQFVGVDSLVTHHKTYVFDLPKNDQQKYWLAVCNVCDMEVHGKYIKNSVASHPIAFSSS